MSENNRAWYYGIEKLKHGIISEINCAFLAKVIKYSKKEHVADIKPLARMSDGQESAQFLDIPVSDNCYLIDELIDKIRSAMDKQGVVLPRKHFMRAGALVVCIVLDRDSDNFNGSTSTYMPNSSRLHNANDSVIVSVLGDDI